MEEPASEQAIDEFIADSPLPEPETAPTNQASVPSENGAASFLTSAHIGGVRAGDRPKLIMNGESYVPGDLVDDRFGLRFVGIRDEKLAFKDENGIVYLKSFWLHSRTNYFPY